MDQRHCVFALRALQPQRALEYARTVVDLGQAKGLRLWQPALAAAALRGDTALADEADAMITAAGLDLTGVLWAPKTRSWQPVG